MIVPGIGELLPWGELWLLIHERCGHDQYFVRNQWNYDDEHVLAEVRQHYATCPRREHSEQARHGQRREQAKDHGWAWQYYANQPKDRDQQRQ